MSDDLTSTTVGAAGPPARRRKYSITISLGSDLIAALDALYPANKSAYLDALLREQPAIRDWLAARAQGDRA